MVETDFRTSSYTLRARPRSTALWVLLLIAVAGNIYQFVESQRMARDLAVLRLNVQNQLSEMRELESGALEQNVRRFDELNKKVEGIAAAALVETKLQTRSEVRRLLGDDDSQ
jgi:hypothetical protein